MYDLVDRYLRRLDSELFKFKCELEADHNGITEILEKRSLEFEGNGSSTSGSTINCNNVLLNSSTSNAGNSQKDNRFFGTVSTNIMNTPQNREKYKARPEKRRNSSTSGGPLEKRPALSTPVPSVVAAPPNLKVTVQLVTFENKFPLKMFQMNAKLSDSYILKIGK